MNDMPPDRPARRWLLRLAFIPAAALLSFAVNLFGYAMTRGQGTRQAPLPPLHRLFLVSALPAVAWVILGIPVQFATRRLARTRVSTAVGVHLLVLAGFIVSHGVLTVGLRVAAGVVHPSITFSVQLEQHIVGFLPMNLLVYAAVVAGTLAWDNWRLSVQRERTAARLAVELTRAELAALRSRLQPHFLFNALHGISSVMDTDATRARRMMAALSHLLRSSLSAGAEHVPLEQELHFTRDYLELQHMRFEERLQYDVQVDADPHLRVPSFILQPLVENAVIHGMGDRPEPTRVHVAVRELADAVEIDVSDNGPGFPQEILDGTRTPGVGLGALRARLLTKSTTRGTMTLRNQPEGGARVIVRVAKQEDGTADA